MVSADTNVIVRLLVGDDKAQLEKAKLLFAQEQIFIATSSKRQERSVSLRSGSREASV